MLLRMGLIAILVLAMAGPFLQGWLFPGFGRKASRDVVLVFDGSYSMSYTEGDPSAHDQAKAWAPQFVQGLNAGRQCGDPASQAAGGADRRQADRGPGGRANGHREASGAGRRLRLAGGGSGGP